MPELTIFNKPRKGIFDEASYDNEGMVHDFNNLLTKVAEEPKKISEALQDDSWVQAMQEELLQFSCKGLCPQPPGFVDPDLLKEWFIRWSKLCMDCIKLIELDPDRFLMYLTASRPEIMFAAVLVLVFRYALTTNPTIHASLVKQFWQTATAKTLANGTLELHATIDTIAYTITEASIRNKLQLADASGVLEGYQTFVAYLLSIAIQSVGHEAPSVTNLNTSSSMVPPTPPTNITYTIESHQLFHLYLNPAPLHLFQKEEATTSQLMAQDCMTWRSRAQGTQKIFGKAISLWWKGERGKVLEVALKERPKEVLLSEFMKRKGNRGSGEEGMSDSSLLTDSMKSLSTSPVRGRFKRRHRCRANKKTGKRRKQIARKGFHTHHDKDETEDSDEANEKDNSTSGTKIPINPVPVATKSPSIANYKIIKQGRKGVYQIDCDEGKTLVMNEQRMNLKKVHCLNLESVDVYMLIERKYPLSAEVCKAMLDKKLQGGKPDEDCYKLLKMIEKQAGIRKHKDWLVQEQTALGKDSSNPLMADNLPKIVWLSTHHICRHGHGTFLLDKRDWLTPELMDISG
ncbi:hypothetical protein Tco_0606389 [Tanacetum coccineum]